MSNSKISDTPSIFLRWSALQDPFLTQWSTLSIGSRFRQYCQVCKYEYIFFQLVFNVNDSGMVDIEYILGSKSALSYNPHKAIVIST